MYFSPVYPRGDTPHTYTHAQTRTHTLSTRLTLLHPDPPPPRTPPTSHPKSWECLHVVQTENERQKLGTPVTTYHRTKFSSESESPPPRYQHIFFHLPEPLFVKLPSTLLPREVFFFFFPPRGVNCNDVPSLSVSFVSVRHETHPARRRSSVLHKEAATCNCTLGSPPIERRRPT